MEFNDYQLKQIHKEIDLIQDCIKRMASNSFYLKGWYIAMLGFTANVSTKDNFNVNILGVGLIFITAIFWVLDGYFLKQEHLYREKYKWIIQERIKGNQNYLYDLNPLNNSMWLNEVNISTTYYMFKKSVCLFYPVLCLGIVCIYFIFK